MEYRGTDHALDFLQSYAHLLAWSWQNQRIEDAENLTPRANSAEAEAVFKYAIEVRELLYHIFVAWLENQPMPLERFQKIHKKTLISRSLAATQQGVVRVWEGNSLERVVWPIIIDAEELLISDQLHKVRQCPNCGWLFVDTSRNGARRWCSMDFCGSKVKSRRQYERKLQSKDAN